MKDFFTENAETLLGRAPLCVVDSNTAEYIKNKTVLVTGGGGSIGSELCRQAVKYGAEKVVAFDVNENNVHSLCEQMISDGTDERICVEIGSVRDSDRILRVMEKHRPDVVFHAAAHKHVSMMERNPAEAVKNNIIGTYNTVKAAERAGVGRFVLISTDKAVYPTTVMGATKRFCEYIISAHKNSTTSFAAVRFGNVLGSVGSVGPIFARAIECGETLRITDENAERYFMTVPEAVGLVMCAAAMKECGIYVLDMGEPVKICELAKRIGYVIGKNVKMKFVGLGSAEKLTESLAFGEMSGTSNPYIHYEGNREVSADTLNERLAILQKSSIDDDSAREALCAAVDEYR